MKYKAIRDSHGYQGRFWAKGETVEVPDGGEVPPKEHFAPEGEEQAPEGQEPEPSDKSQDTDKEPEPEATPEPESHENDVTQSEAEPEPAEDQKKKAPVARPHKPSQGATHRRVRRRK